MKHKFFLLILLFTAFMAQSLPVIESINFEGNEHTSSTFLLQLSGLHVGDKWDATKKNEVLSRINGRTSIIETSELHEIYDDANNTVTITINIREKLSMILIPFFTYSNSGGFTPKIIFRHYNIAGWGKYLGTKLEFKPTGSLGLFFTYKDFGFLNYENLHFTFDISAKSSTPNYNITSIKPIGVFDYPENARWNPEDENIIKPSFEIKYQNPTSKFQINSKLSFEYEGLYESDPAVPTRRYFRPNFFVGTTIPITPYFEFLTSFKYEQESIQREKKQLNYFVEYGNTIDYYYTLANEINPIYKIGVGFPNMTEALNININFVTSFTRNLDVFITSHEFDVANTHKKRNEYFLDLGLETNFSKRFYYNPNLSNSISLSHSFMQRVFDYDDTCLNYLGEDSDYQPWKDVNNTFTTSIWLTNQLDYKFFKRHHFSFKFQLFYYYNDVNTYLREHKTNAKTIAQVEKWIYDYDEDFVLGENLGYYQGYAGAIIHLFYRIPFASFTTPSFIAFRVDRELFWDVFFTLFIDAGLSQNYSNTHPRFAPYYLKLGTDKLNLLPALYAGVKLEVIPKFMPALVAVELSADIYRIIRAKSLSGKIGFSFGIDNQ